MDNEDEFDLEDEVETPDGSAESGTDAGAPEDGKPGDDKRINDLMSKWQQAEARAKKAEEALKAKGNQTGAGGMDPQQAVEWLREQARDQVFKSDPRFARFGIEPGSIEGETPEAMRSSAQALTELIDKIETSAKNAALKQFGLNPDMKGGGPGGKAVDFASMSDEEFEKAVRRAKGTL